MLDEDLQADFYIWANRREGTYASWPRMGYSFNQPSVLRWYGAKITRNSTCAACGSGATCVNPEDETFFRA